MDKTHKITKKNIVIAIGVSVLVLVFANSFIAQVLGSGKVDMSLIGAKSVDDPSGARIESVNLMGYASRFGLQAGDIVTEINGKTVKNADSFNKIMSNLALDSTVTIQVLRYGVELTVVREADSSKGSQNNWRERQIPQSHT